MSNKEYTGKDLEKTFQIYREDFYGVAQRKGAKGLKYSLTNLFHETNWNVLDVRKDKATDSVQVKVEIPGGQLFVFSLFLKKLVTSVIDLEKIA